MNGQSAAKLPSQEEGSTTISRKESTILIELEKVNAKFYTLYDRLPDVKGIYGIYNCLNDKIYIGSAKNIHKRKVRHLWYLNHNCHHSSKLQASYNLYKENFVIYIIDITEDLKTAEFYWINKLDSYKNGYNSTDKTWAERSFTLTQESINKSIEKSSLKVLAIDATNTVIHEFSSVSSAARFVGTSSSNVSRCCQGKFVFIKKFRFVYKSDYKIGINYVYKPKIIVSEATRKIRSDFFKGRKHTVEHRRNLAIIQGKAVSKINPQTGEILQQYISIREAELTNSIAEGTLRSAIIHKTPRNGYIYKFSKDIV